MRPVVENEKTTVFRIADADAVAEALAGAGPAIGHAGRQATADTPAPAAR